MGCVAYREHPPALTPGDIEECPSCHVRVIVPDDLRCPSCQADMLEAEDDGQRRLKVTDHQSDLPPFCATCGSSTNEHEVVSAREGQIDTSDRVIVGFLLMLLSPFLMLLMNFRGGRTLEVAIPRCRPCSKGPKLEPDHINFEQGTMTLLVHYRLGEAAVEE